KLIVEVLSLSTEAHDRGDKFLYYRSIPEFSEYLLVNQYQPWVDHYIKTERGEWMMRSYQGIDSMIELSTVDQQLSLTDVYEDVELADQT
ncbi:MAG: Uma2 family endonuclease, partial [Cyanobacteria bacterium J06635_15]